MCWQLNFPTIIAHWHLKSASDSILYNTIKDRELFSWKEVTGQYVRIKVFSTGIMLAVIIIGHACDVFLRSWVCIEH